VTVRQVAQAADDGFRTDLAPGLKATADARRLAGELAFAAARLAELAAGPPGAYADIAALDDREEALWLAFLVAWLSPLEGDDPFAAIRAAHVPWASGERPALDGVPRGPRAAAASPRLGARRSSAPDDPARTVDAYRAWAQRAGSQEAALAGDAAWTPERRFGRAFERLALPGLGRAARFDLLVTLGRLGLLDLRAGDLQLGDDATSQAAKRVFGIGDKILLERRAAELAAGAGVPLEALDLALFNFGQPDGARATMGSRAEPEAAERDRIAATLGA
jgi:hypothetical protein